MLSHLLLLAQQSSETSTAPQGSLLFSLLPLMVIVGLFWFLMVRPMKRQEHERQSLLSALKKNDKVVTSGGIIGIVAAVKDKEDEVTLKVDESSNVRLRVTKSSIVRILGGEEAGKEQKDGGA
jgi:preprotein translocase subunit YajC